MNKTYLKIVRSEMQSWDRLPIRVRRLAAMSNEPHSAAFLHGMLFRNSEDYVLRWLENRNRTKATKKPQR